MTTILLINDEPDVLELQERLIRAHAPEGMPLKILRRSSAKTALPSTLGSRLDLALVDPGVSEGIRMVASHFPHAEIWACSCMPKGSIPAQPLEIPVHGTVCWARNGSFTEFIKRWLAIETVLPS